MANEQPDKKKRRIRPATTTVREQAEQVRIKNAEPKQTSRIKQGFSTAGKPLGFVGRPLKWLGRHIIPRYFRNSFNELRLVTWPSRKESRQLTAAVLIFAAVFGFVITVVDYGLDKVFKKVFLR